MSQVVCPSCNSTATRMPVLSDISHVDYYHCTDCHQVSMAPKNGTGPVVPLKLTPAERVAQTAPTLDGAGF